MVIGRKHLNGLTKALIGAGLAGCSFTAFAQQAPGWYFGLEGFYSGVNKADANIQLTAPNTNTPGTANGCILPIDLLGSPVALGPLCILGNNGQPGTIVPGATTQADARIKFKDGIGGGMSFGYLFDGGLRPEINLRYAQNDVDKIETSAGSTDSDAKFRALRVMGNVWYDLDFGNIAPYFGGGFGFQQSKLENGGENDSDLTTAYQLGAGIAYWFSNHTAISLDYRFVTADDPKFKETDASTGIKSQTKTEYEANNIGATFRYSFGGEFSDSDGDGVLDRKDKCPNTPKGVQVYSDGCPIDLDQDGVPDYLDKCPNTPPGSPVDSNGCPFDSDGDGIPDSLDQCPGTPPGIKVDGKGCPLDADGDGIPDYLDQCPGTKAGAAVNAQGCEITDKDGDGIPDNLDKCPDSPKGQKVGPDGCPLDSDGDGIPDDQDECPHTPPGLKVLPNGCALKGDCRTPRPGEKVDAKGCAVDQRFVLRGVKFEFDSDRLTKPAEKILDDVGDTLAAYPDVSVDVEGHTDSTGTDAYNLGLSERRANAVKKYLTGRGVKATRMKPVGYGETKPIADNNTPEGQEENRRVEFKVIGD